MVVNSTPGERELPRCRKPSPALHLLVPALDSGTPRAGRGDQNRVFYLGFSDFQR